MFMPAAGVEAQHACVVKACLLGVALLTAVAMYCATPLKGIANHASAIPTMNCATPLKAQLASKPVGSVKGPSLKGVALDMVLGPAAVYGARFSAEFHT
jgi:hypothetical protein